VKPGRTPDGLYYEVHEGPEGAPAVVLSADLGGSGHFWKPQMAKLTGLFTVVLYDHRGTGRSDRTLPLPHSVDHMAADIVRVMDDAGIAKAHVVGHAAGGLAGLALALNHPARLDRLCVVNGWSRPDPYIARCFEARTGLLTGVGPAAYVRAQPIFLYPASWIAQNAASVADEEAQAIAHFPATEVMLARIQALLAFDIEARLGEIAHPVLVAASSDDMLVPMLCSDRMAVGLPNATLDVAPWGGHAFTVTAPGRFNWILSAFLADKPLPHDL
jgi:aminoacrylate hydrolase